jgi:hypothetical protein
MIRCPKTDDPVDTGVVMGKEAFESGSTPLINITLGKCPACGESHAWSKYDAFLEE